jgi:sugar-specific transcriptional regulator TrmB
MKQILKEIGLSEKEAKVYIALLKLGKSSTQIISKETGINRVSLYDILNYLIEKGFVTQIIENKIKKYFAISAKNILNKLKEKEKKFADMIPEFEKLEKSEKKVSNVKIFQGEKVIDIINEDIFKNKNFELLSYGPYSLINEMQKYTTINYMKRRIENNINAKVISDEKLLKNPFLKKEEYNIITEIKLNKKIAEIKSWHYIYNNKYSILSIKDNSFIAIIIEDQTIAQDQKKIFEILWKNSEN